MAEYIERETAIATIMSEPPDAHYPHWYADKIKAIPAANVAPVVHGHFVHDGPRFAGGVDWWHCSNCGGLFSGVETQFEYCPHCGAKMDGGDSDEAD